MEEAPSLLHRITRPLLVGGIVVSGVLLAAHPASAAGTSSPLSSITVNPSSVVGGTTSTGTVNLAAPAPADGALIMISDTSAATSVPYSVTVPAGATSGSFTIPTVPVASTTTSTISARTDAGSVTTPLQVRAPAPVALSINATTVLGGRSATGTVTLDAPAPSGGLWVGLSDNSIATAPAASAYVAANATKATFNISTSPVSTRTQATIFASASNVTRSATLEVRPARAVSLSMNPSSVPGGTSSRGTLTLEGPAGPEGNTFPLTDNSSVVGTPASVTVPPGSTSAGFDVATMPVPSTTVATISSNGYGYICTYSSWYGTTCGYRSYSVSASLTVRVAGLASVGVNPSEVTGGQSATGTVVLDGPAAAPITVNLSSDSAMAEVPASVVVPAGATSATFPVTTLRFGESGEVTITASTPGMTQATQLMIWASFREPICGPRGYC